MFVGYLRVLENELAVRRLVEAIWPRVMRTVPGEPLHVVGAGAPAWLCHLGERCTWLEVHGAVPHVSGLLRSAAVSVLPITGGGGIKTKALQSFAFGIPVIATPDALRGIPAVDGEHAVLADCDDDLADAASRVLEDASLWARLSAGGRALLTEHFGREPARHGLRTALSSPGGGEDRL